MYTTGPAKDGHTHTLPSKCCTSCEEGGPCATGDFNAPATLITLGVIGVGAALLFPKAWDRFMDSLWG